MECPACGGYAEKCDFCKRTGAVDVTDCPLELIDYDVWELLDLAGLYKKGLPPESGGALDQAFCFVQGCRFVWNEEQYWKAKLKVIE